MIDKKRLRGKLFKHLDGLVTAPTLVALNEKGVLEHFLKQNENSLSDLTAKYQANEGYLNVALRILASQGLLTQEIDVDNNEVKFSLTSKGSAVFPIAHVYNEVVDLIKLSGNYHPRKFERKPFAALYSLFGRYKQNCGLEPAEDAIMRTVH